MSIPIVAIPQRGDKLSKKFQECATLPWHRPASQRLGIQNKPIIHIEPDNVQLSASYIFY